MLSKEGSDYSDICDQTLTLYVMDHVPHVTMRNIILN
jgi:hypothetical protein